MSCAAFFLPLLLMPGALAGRRASILQTDPAPTIKSLASDTDVICGGSEIWRIITANPTVSGVQSINWEKIDATAQDYIRTQEALIKRLGNELDALARQIEEKKGEERVQDISPEQIRELITSATASFDGLESAQRTKCGVPSIRPRAPRGAFRKSTDEFRASAEGYFTGEVRLGSAPFLDVCGELLPCQEGESCYCTSLCQNFRDVAQEVSDATAGASAGTSADELMRQEKEKLSAQTDAKQELSQCSHARETLLGFRAQFEELKSGVKTRFDALRAAEEALDDAQWELGELEDMLEKEEEAAAEALKALEAAGAEASQAKASFEALQQQEQELGQSVEASKASLQAGRQELEAAKNADRVVGELKNAVSVTLMKMSLLFDEAVLQPVRNIGITEDLDLAEYFTEDAAETGAAGAKRTAVDALHTFCAVEAKEAFLAVKDKVDLSPLCDMGEAGAIDSDLNSAVMAKMAQVKEQIEELKSWLNPYKDQKDITEARLNEFLEAGEPKGLREIVGVYGQTEFYGYLKHWKAGGKFLQLIAQLRETVDSLDAALGKLKKDLEQLKEELQQTVDARKAAQEELERAAKEEELAADQKAQLEAKVKELQEQGAQMEKGIEEFEAEVAKAKEQYQVARDKLLAAHKESTSFAQLWGEEEDDLLHVLRVRAARAQDRLLLLQAETRRAERAYADAEDKVGQAERKDAEGSSQ